MPVISAAAYPQLMSAVTDSEKIVYLCGAGASMSLGAHQLSWTKWLLAGKEYLTAAEQTELEQKIGRWTTSELIDAATYLLAGLKAAGNYQNLWIRPSHRYILSIRFSWRYYRRSGVREI